MPVFSLDDAIEESVFVETEVDSDGDGQLDRVHLRLSRRLQLGKEYTFRWDLQPDDHVFASGHRIGLVVVSTDFDHTLRPLPGTHLTVHPASSRLVLPLAAR